MGARVVTVAMVVGARGEQVARQAAAQLGFHFVSDSVVAQGTLCECDLAVTESLDGYLLPTPFALLPDGGLPPVNGLTATLADSVSDAGSGAPCVCATPCTVSYAISGTPF